MEACAPNVCCTQEVRTRRTAAKAQASGGGTEAEEWYGAAEVVHLNNDGIRALKDAFDKLREGTVWVAPGMRLSRMTGILARHLLSVHHCSEAFHVTWPIKTRPCLQPVGTRACRPAGS